MIERVELFDRYKERLLFFVLLLFLLFSSLTFRYIQYQNFLKKRFLTATVINQYQKNGHIVLKLKSGDITFYTTSKEDLKNLLSRRVEVLLFHSKKRSVSFKEYLRTFYIPSYIMKVLPKNLPKERLAEEIASQHHDPFFAALFSALFVATPLTTSIREHLSFFGISHLVAISGFHLALLSSILTFIALLFLKPLFQRFFPYLNLYRYAVLSSLFGAFCYTLFLGDIPSVVRSFVMLVVAFILFDRHIKLLSFELLFWVVLLLLALFPHFFFSIGFWLSVSGVFMIYLFLHHFQLSALKSFFALNFWVFWMMQPIVWYIFGKFAYFQFLAPIFSIVFTFFYPLELFLHLVGYGGSLDSWLLWLKSEPSFMIIDVSIGEFGLYLALLLLAIRFRLLLWAAFVSVGVMLIYHLA